MATSSHHKGPMKCVLLGGGLMISLEAWWWFGGVSSFPSYCFCFLDRDSTT